MIRKDVMICEEGDDGDSFHTGGYDTMIMKHSAK